MNYNNNKGFSLMEIMIVVAIIGLLISISMPNISKIVSKGKGSATIAEMNAIKLAIKAFKQDFGYYPQRDSSYSDEEKVVALKDLNSRPLNDFYLECNPDLWRGPYMDTSFSKKGKGEGYGTDSWGSPYLYSYELDENENIIEEYGIFLRSAGPNQILGDKDDEEVIVVPSLEEINE